jgi:glucan phosphoethanolaminetransferase (alkaline phosphatase superfamily)
MRKSNMLLPLALVVFGFVTLLIYAAYAMYSVFLCWYYAPDTFKQACAFMLPIVLYFVAGVAFAVGMDMFRKRYK